MKLYPLSGASPVTGTVKTPVNPLSTDKNVAGTLVTLGSPMFGSLSELVREKTTPNSVTSSPPSEVTFPPRVAVVAVMSAEVGEAIPGAVAGGAWLKVSVLGLRSRLPAVASS